MNTAEKNFENTIRRKWNWSALHAMLAAAVPLLPWSVAAQGLQLANPHWNITLTDYGYSDFLLDNTPGFEGREYLSGEWGAAVAYQESTGGGTVSMGPEWLEPQFVFPDWTTDSSFHVVTPLTQIGMNADGLPIAESVIANGSLEITLRHEMLDTVTGVPMGASPASTGGEGLSVKSDRYVLKQTCTVKNISGSPISKVQVFQFLHGLHSQRGIFDDRAYGGPFSEFSYDLTLVGVDPWATGAGSSSAGLEDYISFHASAAPTAFEVGYYGLEGNGVDAHALGKPSEGVHLSVEDNWQHPPYAARAGRDEFAPPQRWLSGAQRWELGNLTSGQTASMDVLLTLLTGTKVSTGSNNSGGCDGGSSVPGGVDYSFEDVTSSGSFFGDYSKADEAEIEVRILQGDFDVFTFPVPGGPAQVWELEFNGAYSGDVSLTFGYDASILPPGFDESKLCIYQYTGGAWQRLNGTADPIQHKISVATPTLSAFVLGVNSANVFSVSATAAPPAGGSASGAGSYANGSSATLVATPAAGYVFANWTEGDAVASGSPSYTFIVHNSRSLQANFTPAGLENAVTTSALPANGGTTSGGGAYAPGASATVVATPNSGYKFSKWVDGETVLSTLSSYTFTVTGDLNLVAKFKPVCTIITSPEPPNGGEISADTLFEAGELAVLKAKPNRGYSFVNWTQNGVTVSTQPNYQFTATANRVLVAHFAPGNRFDLVAEPVNGGAVSGGGVHSQDATVVLTAAANPGYVFVNWTESGVPVSTSAVYQTISTASRSLVANFIAQPSLSLMPWAPGELRASWPAAATGWILQGTLDFSSANWEEVPGTIIVGNQKQVVISTTASRGFFRLWHP